MKLFIKLRNKYFATFTSLILLILASVGLFNFAGTIKSVDASMIKFDEAKTITITNGSFNSFSSSSTYPYTLNSFTTSGNSTPNMKTGAINLSETEFSKNYSKYGLSEYDRPSEIVGSDNYALMINADATSNYTYTSSEFTLPANGHYYITVSAMTIGDNAVASVFLTKDNQVFENCVIEQISTGSWANYTFFVTTNAYESVTLKFGMQIGNRINNNGASGCVLFDELHAGQISAERLNECLKSFPAGSFKYAEFRSPNAYKMYNFDSQIIDYSQNKVGETTTRNYFADATSGVGEANFEVRNNIMTLSANDSFIIYKGEEETLMPDTTYRFSIFVKASQLSSGSAFVKVEEIIDESEDYDDFMDSTPTEITAKSSNLTISAVTSNTITDGYQEYAIYVNTGTLKSSKVQFSFGLGSESANATGLVNFKSYLIERVPYSAFSSASTGSQVGKIDIAERITSVSSEYANYSFNKMQSNSFDGVPYPATPSSWSVSSSNTGTQLSGVVNLSKFSAVMAKYESSINEISTPKALHNTLNNNVLMIYNGTKGAQSYTSSSKTLSANKHYQITMFVNTHIWDIDSNGATVLAKVGENVIAMADGIKTVGEWQKVVLYIQTPANSVDLTIELALGSGNKLSSGYAFFDDILVQEADSNNFVNRYPQYEIATNGNVEVDLNNPMLASTTMRDYNTPVLYNGVNNGTTTVNAGIVDLTGDLKIVSDSIRENLRDINGDNKNALAIATAVNEDGRYTYTSVLKYNFASGKYYKFSFDLFTDGIGQEEKEEMYDNDILAEGVSVSLTGLENAKFSYVKSEGQWTTYEIYVGVNTSATSNLVFALGSEFTGCYGKAFIGNINLEEVDHTVFEAISVGDKVLKVDTVEQTDEENNDTDKKLNMNGFSWAYVPTIATFLAIVIAVVGIFVRRNVKFTKSVGKKRVEYDRDITVMQNKYRRIASDVRAKEIRELTKERDELMELRAEYEEKYKDALSRLRNARLANRNGSKQHEIVAIEREVKHISKEVARFGVQVNNYDNEIEFMQTEAYLIDLEKRMMREDTSMRNVVRKEAEMSEEKRAESVAKREAKQQRAEQKAQARADKLIRKQEKLKQEREAVQAQLAEAKELDERHLKERELKLIQIAEQKLAKEKAKAEREMLKLEQAKLAKQKAEEEEKQEQVNSSVEDEKIEAETVETEQVIDEQPTQETNQNVEQESAVESEVKQDEVVENLEETVVQETSNSDESNQ